METQQSAMGTSDAATPQGGAPRKVAQRVAGLKDPAAARLGHYAEAVREVSRQFHAQDRVIAGQYAERAAGQVQRLSDYLQHTDVDDLLREVETVARRNPTAFLGAAFAIGVGAARFLKSSQRAQSARVAAGSSTASLGAAGAAEHDVTGARLVGSDLPAGTGAGLQQTGAAIPPSLDDYPLR